MTLMGNTTLRDIQDHLVLVLHAHQCRRHEQPTTSSLVCQQLRCAQMRSTLQHMIQCTDSTICSCRSIIII